MLADRLARAALVAGTLLLACSATPLAADEENPFGYVYSAETLSKGEREASQWVTARLGKEGGSYAGYDLRTEIETGLTDRLQAAFYVNTRAHRIHGVEDLEDRSSYQFQGVSAELKYRLRSPRHDGYGLALYVEPGYNRVSRVSGEVEKELELETRVIFQKNFLDDTLIWSLNYTLEPEWAIGSNEEHGAEDEPGEEGEARRELSEELSTGLSFRVASDWSAGVELVARSVWPDFSHRESTALYLGPNLSYGAGRWWGSLSVLPQLRAWPSAGASGLDLHDGERLQVRLKLGFEF
jgi:hypothetical protein